MSVRAADGRWRPGGGPAAEKITWSGRGNSGEDHLAGPRKQREIGDGEIGGRRGRVSGDRKGHERPGRVGGRGTP
ncbi:hypothetical protein [Streptosporangium vulgare]|uniref:hypothetical protein n=1 Tax=Streptosporangium vulgare TaxID=46190 RepID=UPI0031D774FA